MSDPKPEGADADDVSQGFLGEPPPNRRTAPRYSPDPLVPVLFAHPDAETPTAGLIADVSNGGVRIVAPPTARPHLHWADPLTLLLSYSDSSREGGVEGLTLRASVVRIFVDASGYTLGARFDRANGDWTLLEAWIHQLARR
jgi:hypothetical protein